MWLKTFVPILFLVLFCLWYGLRYWSYSSFLRYSEYFSFINTRYVDIIYELIVFQLRKVSKTYHCCFCFFSNHNMRVVLCFRHFFSFLVPVVFQLLVYIVSPNTRVYDTVYDIIYTSTISISSMAKYRYRISVLSP